VTQKNETNGDALSQRYQSRIADMLEGFYGFREITRLLIGEPQVVEGPQGPRVRVSQFCGAQIGEVHIDLDCLAKPAVDFIGDRQVGHRGEGVRVVLTQMARLAVAEILEQGDGLLRSPSRTAGFGPSPMP